MKPRSQTVPDITFFFFLFFLNALFEKQQKKSLDMFLYHKNCTVFQLHFFCLRQICCSDHDRHVLKMFHCFLFRSYKESHHVAEPNDWGATECLSIKCMNEWCASWTGCIASCTNPVLQVGKGRATCCKKKSLPVIVVRTLGGVGCSSLLCF